MTLPRIAICGPGGCGKDTAADWLAANTPLTRGPGTSQIIAPHIAAEDGITVDEAFAGRREQRERWAAKGDDLCKKDPAFLVRECLKAGQIVVGIRRLKEIQTVRAEKMVDLVVWIQRPAIPRDPTLAYGREMADVIMRNNESLDRFYERLAALARFAGLLPNEAP